MVLTLRQRPEVRRRVSTWRDAALHTDGQVITVVEIDPRTCRILSVVPIKDVAIRIDRAPVRLRLFADRRWVRAGGTRFNTCLAERKKLRQLRARELHAEVSTWNPLSGTNLSATWQSVFTDPWLCVPVSRRVCLFRGSWAQGLRHPIENSTQLNLTKKYTSDFVRQQSSQ